MSGLVDRIAQVHEEHRTKRGGWMNFPEPGFSVTCMCGAHFEDATCPYPSPSERADAVNKEFDAHRAAAVASALRYEWAKRRDVLADVLADETNACTTDALYAADSVGAAFFGDDA